MDTEESNRNLQQPHNEDDQPLLSGAVTESTKGVSIADESGGPDTLRQASLPHLPRLTRNIYHLSKHREWKIAIAITRAVCEIESLADTCGYRLLLAPGLAALNCRQGQLS